jgi:hypothetical protein
MLAAWSMCRASDLRLLCVLPRPLGRPAAQRLAPPVPSHAYRPFFYTPNALVCLHDTVPHAEKRRAGL